MYTRFGKRFIDFSAALFLSIGLAPLFIIIYLILKKNFSNPIFLQKRPGLNGKLFTIYKFRTMSPPFDRAGRPVTDDKRITRFGNILRILSLDEIPQLFNVLKSDISLVGPRPLLPEYMELYSEKQKKRHLLKPGMTGWAQINGRNGISWEEKLNLDLYYIDHASLFLDIKIIVITFIRVITISNVYTSEKKIAPKFTGKN